MRKALFVTIEGVDGAGKSTHARLLGEHMRAAGFDVVLTREPGGTPVGDKVRAILLDPASGEICSRAEALLFAAARAQHVQQVIRPALAAGKVVICERFVDSSLAFQGYGLGLDLDFLRALNDAATGELRPHLTILLDVTPETALVRKGCPDGADRIERRGEGYRERVRRGYLELAGAEPARVKVIASVGDVAQVQGRVREIVRRFVGSRGDA